MANIFYRLVTGLLSWIVVLFLFSIFVIVIAESSFEGLEKLPRAKGKKGKLGDYVVYSQLGGVSGALSGALFGAFLADWRRKKNRRYAIPFNAMGGSFIGLFLGALFGVVACFRLDGPDLFKSDRLLVPISLGFGGGITVSILIWLASGLVRKHLNAKSSSQIG
jgi:MFS family permease